MSFDSSSGRAIKSAEIFIGFAVLLFTVFIGWHFASDYFYETRVSKSDNYNHYCATFTDIDGLIVGSDVKIGGVSVGKLTSYEIDEKSYKIKVCFSVSDKYKIADDSSIIVATTGFIGQKYLKLTPGHGDNFLTDHEEILLTQSSINAETLLSLLKK